VELLVEARSTGTESLCPEKLSELDSLSALLQNFARAIDVQAQEHYRKCTKWYHAYATDYDDYVAEWYIAYALTDDELYLKLRKACKAYLASRAMLTPHERWPEFHRALESRKVEETHVTTFHPYRPDRVPSVRVTFVSSCFHSMSLTQVT
jgi:hypothetical protein